jgi:hypothetical protein
LVLHDGKPITKACLHKHFKRELADGGAKVKALIGQKFVEAVQRGEQWAIKLGMRNRYGWVGAEGSQPLPIDDFGASVSDDMIRIKFIMPDKQPVVDIKPPAPQPSPYEGQAPDLSKPALEPPRSTSIHTGYPGIGPWRTNSDPKTGWMK